VILILGDPLSRLNPRFDGSLYLARSFFRLKKRVFWATPEDCVWSGYRMRIRATELQDFQRGELPPLKSVQVFDLKKFQAVVVRKDPPFDENYLRLCWLLSAFENEVLFVNRPSLLCRFHEKMLPYEGLQRGFLKPVDLIPMGLTQTSSGLKEILSENESEDWVQKPWLGFAGHRVERFSRSQLQDLNVENLSANVIFQPFEKGIFQSGDRRVFFLKAKYLGDFVRVPAAGGFISNTAQGGSYESRPLSTKEKSLIQKCERFLKSIRLDFVGADFINGRLNEMNITSPTGFAPFEELTGKDLSQNVARRILADV